jgi:hypothetical protein
MRKYNPPPTSGVGTDPTEVTADAAALSWIE